MLTLKNTDEIIEFLKEKLEIKTDVEFAKKLGLSDRAVTTWKQRNSFNCKKIIDFALKNKIDLNELFGKNEFSLNSISSSGNFDIKKNNKININLVLDRLKNILNLKKDIDLSEKLGKSRSTVAVWRKRENIDYEAIIKFAIQNNISLDYLFSNVDNETIQFKEKETNLLKKLEKRLKRIELKLGLYNENF